MYVMYVSHLHGVSQCGVSVAGRLQALQQAGVNISAPFNEVPCSGQLLLQQLIEGKQSWVEGAES